MAWAMAYPGAYSMAHSNLFFNFTSYKENNNYSVTRTGFKRYICIKIRAIAAISFFFIKLVPSVFSPSLASAWA